MKTAAGLEIPTTLADLADPARTALLVYDMQVGIRSQIAGADVIVARCAEAIAAARAAGMRIAYTRHLSPPAAWMGATQYRTDLSPRRTTTSQL